MNKLYIFSLKYAPGLSKEILLLSQSFSKFYDVKNILSSGYRNNFNSNSNNFFLNNGIGIKGMFYDFLLFFVHLIKFIFKFFNFKTNTIILFYNPHPLNWLYSFFLKIFFKIKICTVLHEPYKTNEEKKIYGFFQYYYFYIVELSQKLSIHFSNVVITVSPHGSYLFEKYYPKFNRSHIKSNLLFENVNDNRNIDRKYFSFVGRVNKGKGIYEFIDLVNYSNKKKDNLKFCLITSSNISEFISHLDGNYHRNLKIINKPKISDTEINNIISQSYAVFSIHNVASQSGVLPLSYSYKTPAIIRDIPAFTQYKIDDNIILSKNFNTEEIYKVCLFVLSYRNNFSFFEKKCLLAFNNYFSKDNFEKFYERLLTI